MGKHSGEQARRVLRGLEAHERYDQTMMARDKLRLVKALRDTANRIEGEARGETAQIRAARQLASPVAVTDHAVLRFLERVAGIDIDAIRAQIARLVPPAAVRFGTSGAVGEHAIYVRDGFQFLVTPLSVISVLTPEMDGQRWLERDDLEALGAA